MTKRSSQANTVVVPAVHAVGVDGKVVTTKPVVAAAEGEVAVQAAEVKADEAPVTTVVEPVAALVVPAPMAMVAEPAAAAAEPAAAASVAQSDDGDSTDLTPYIVGGVLILGGVLAVALSSGDTDPIPVTPAPTNTAPNFTSGLTATIAENAPIATIVYDANAADTQGNAITFTIGGTDAALFAIDATTGVVTLRNSANFEAKPTYSFTVTATDNGTPSLSATQTIAVTVSNVNEAPTFTSATATATTPENIPTTTVVFTAAATDPDAGTTLIYSLSGTDAAAFAISNTGAVTFRTSPDFETKSSYTFVVTASDAATGGLSATQTVTITVTDVAEGPVFTSPATATVAENAAISTVVFDANATGATAFALSGADAGAFDFNTTTGVGTLRTSADFETKASYNVTVTATGAGGTSTQNIVVSVTNVNEAPTFATPTRTTTLAENVAAGTVLFANGGATDVDTSAGAALGYGLGGPDANLFSVNPTTGAVTLIASPNFEAKSSYSFTLLAVDQSGLTTSQANTLTITNVNEAPTFATATQSVNFAENGTGTVLTATATDPDGAAAPNTLTYTLTGADAALFTVSSAGVVTFRAAPDFETPRSAANSNVYSFNVVATDQGALVATQAATVTVTNINEAPAFAAATQAVNFAENGTGTVLTATATDSDGTAAPNTLTYSLTGADAALFNVSSTGVVTFRAAPDFETPRSAANSNVYSFNVVATDQGALSASQAATVTVTNVNEAPAFAAATQSVNFVENGTGTVLTATATDPDGTAAPNTLTYSLTGADAALFTVSATGVVTFRAAPDFETPRSAANSNVYSFNVVATDQGTLFATQAATVTVTNANEAPRFAAATQSVNFAENGTGTVLTATATDPDGAAAPNTLSYTLTGADAALFAVSAAGVVTFRAAPDFETPRSAANSNIYSFNVVATDQGALFATQGATVTVTDVPEGVRIDGGTIPAGSNTNFTATPGNVLFLESGTVGNITTISAFTAGDIIQTDVATSSYSFSSVGADLVISLLNNGISSQITLTGAAGNNFIFNEASAEQAVGFDFFRSTTLPPPAASNNLDGPGAPATFNAANAANIYTDSSTAQNTTTITNFTNDDRIVATGVNGSTQATSYSFSSVGNDLVISFLANQVSSQITLVGAANPNVFVFDEASAEQAVGFDFFRYG